MLSLLNHSQSKAHLNIYNQPIIATYLSAEDLGFHS